jgi:amino acid transporter
VSFAFISRFAGNSLLSTRTNTYHGPYLTQFFPSVEARAVRAMVLGLFIGFLAVANYLGVTSGTRLSNFFTVTKLLVVLLFIAAGLEAILLRPAVRVIPQAMAVTSGDLLEAVLLFIRTL